MCFINYDLSYIKDVSLKIGCFVFIMTLRPQLGSMPVEVNIIPIGKPIKEQKLQTVSTLMVSLTVNYPFFDDFPK